MAGWLPKRPGAKQEKLTEHRSAPGSDSLNGMNKGVSGVNLVHSVKEIRQDNHARHPLGKQWTTKSRDSADKMHSN